MNNQITPRSRQLSPLSHEHQDGDLYVKRIRSGLGKVSGERLLNYTRWFWKNHIKPHFYQEEKILAPYIPVGHPWGIKLKDDHAAIRDYIVSLDQEANKEEFRSLCDLLDKHIAFEERDLFTYLEENLTEEQLNEIASQLKKHPVEPEEWNDVFW